MRLPIPPATTTLPHYNTQVHDAWASWTFIVFRGVHETSPPAAEPAIGTARPRILIADDNPQGAELLEAYLGDSEYDLRTAHDGEETLQQVRTWQPDLILLDIMMPKISGFEVCKRLAPIPTCATSPSS